MLIPLPDQLEDAAKMARGDLPNYSKAGTGKTLTTMEAIKAAGIKRGAVFCPSIALRMWEKSLREYLGATTCIVGASIPKQKADFYITTFGRSHRLAGEVIYDHLKGDKNVAMVLDEAHYLRGVDSKRTTAIFGDTINDKGGLFQEFDIVWPLTGTPIWSFHNDLYPTLKALYPDVLERYGCADYENFLASFTVRKMKSYAKNMEPTLKIVASANELLINRILYKDIGAIRRTKIKGLPSLTSQEYEVSLTPPRGLETDKDLIKTLTKMTEEEAMQHVADFKAEKDENKQKPATTLRRVLGLLTVDPALEFLVEVARSEPVLIGVIHNDVGALVHEKLHAAGLTGHRVYGATPLAQREKTREMFNAGDLNYIVGQMQAMGVSWNLQDACNRIVILEDDPVPGTIEQFYKRVWRRGQTEHCQLDWIHAKCSLADAIKKMRENKERQHKRALD